MPAHELHDRILVALELLVLLQRHAHAGDDEQRAEDVDDPLEPREQRRAEPDEQAAHDERAEDAPEQHAVLVLRRHGEVLEDQHDDEDVVDAERFLDQVAREERQRDLGVAKKASPAANSSARPTQTAVQIRRFLRAGRRAACG